MTAQVSNPNPLTASQLRDIRRDAANYWTATTYETPVGSYYVELHNTGAAYITPPKGYPRPEKETIVRLDDPINDIRYTLKNAVREHVDLMLSEQSKARHLAKAYMEQCIRDLGADVESFTVRAVSERDMHTKRVLVTVTATRHAMRLVLEDAEFNQDYTELMGWGDFTVKPEGTH